MSGLVVIAPNAMRGHLGADGVARGLGRGASRAAPDRSVRMLPVADGGDGTIDVVARAVGGRRHPLDAPDAQGRPQRTAWLSTGSTALVESARCCGLEGLRPSTLAPMRSTSAGVGVVIAAAVRAGFRMVSVGLGGTAVVDGGAGALAALGCTFADARGAPLPPQPRALAAAVKVDLRPAQRLLAGVELRLLSDVDTPYTSSAGNFGAQKGLTERDRPAAAAAMTRLVTLAGDAGPVGGADLLHTRSTAPWWGAGGGIGLGLSAVATASAGSGASAVLELVDPEDEIGRAALVVTAEGAIDRSTWWGKAPGAIAGLRTARGLPTALVAARIDERRDDPGLGWHLLAPDDGSPLDDRLADAGAAAVRWFAATYGEVPA